MKPKFSLSTVEEEGERKKCTRKRTRPSSGQGACAEHSPGPALAIHKTMQEGGAIESGSAAAAAIEEPGPSETSGEQPPEAAKMVLIVGNLEEFATQLKSSDQKLIVVDFTATWCGPCKMIKPFFHSLQEKYPDVIFLEIDVDDAQDVAAHCDVKCMPTFQFYKNNEKVHEFSGANKEKLEETIKNLK